MSDQADTPSAPDPQSEEATPRSQREAPDPATLLRGVFLAKLFESGNVAKARGMADSFAKALGQDASQAALPEPALPAVAPAGADAPTDLAGRLTRLQAYYQDVLAYHISKRERAEAGLTGKKEFTYGVTSPKLMLELLREAGAGPDDVFYDLGCGVGQTVLVASEVCRHAHGVEILPGLLAHAEEARETLGYENVTFHQSDLRHVDLSDGTVLFSFSTCMPPEVYRVMAEKAATTAPGSRIITTTHPLEHAELEVTDLGKRYWYQDKEDKPVHFRVFLHKRH